MREVVTEIEIDAAPLKVWRVLTDFSSYPDWSPFSCRIEGELEVGSQLEVPIKRADQKGKTFRPDVCKANPNGKFRWLSESWGMRFPSAGEHFFILEPTGEELTKLVHGEKSSGLFAPFIWKSLDTNPWQGSQSSVKQQRKGVRYEPVCFSFCPKD